MRTVVIGCFCEGAENGESDFPRFDVLQYGERGRVVFASEERERGAVSLFTYVVKWRGGGDRERVTDFVLTRPIKRKTAANLHFESVMRMRFLAVAFRSVIDPKVFFFYFI